MKVSPIGLCFFSSFFFFRTIIAQYRSSDKKKMKIKIGESLKRLFCISSNGLQDVDEYLCIFSKSDGLITEYIIQKTVLQFNLTKYHVQFYTEGLALINLISVIRGVFCEEGGRVQ